ncbi:hypothetical protein Pcinc_043320 [Petrolisthes cinctipes]|uniref:Uncharacterized protein n=1 Tax=Petrolisthes cinctipes TaxID=88211 RepID=A0AAE1BJ04_PETCI|nr:hypothetical protein Pcinc_043320 [Petrolisthes cinctipes]
MAYSTSGTNVYTPMDINDTLPANLNSPSIPHHLSYPHHHLLYSNNNAQHPYHEPTPVLPTTPTHPSLTFLTTLLPHYANYQFCLGVGSIRVIDVGCDARWGEKPSHKACLNRLHGRSNKPAGRGREGMEK